MLQPEPVRGDLGDLDPKVFRRGKYLNVRVRESCLARQRIGKAKNSTPRHFGSPLEAKIDGHTKAGKGNQLVRTKCIGLRSAAQIPSRRRSKSSLLAGDCS